MSPPILGLLRRQPRLLWYLLIVGILALAELSPSSGSQAETPPLVISAAVSLQESLEEIGPLYRRERGVEVRYNFGGSGALEQQILHGAPVDVFIAAGSREMEALKTRGLVVDGTCGDLVRNELVIATAANSPKISSFADLTRPDVRHIAMAEPASVPAGNYARQTLMHLGLWERLEPKLVFTGDVRQALIDVETGNAEAGLVYDTEVRLSSKLRVAAWAPADSHSPIVYPAAAIRGPRTGAARAFLDFLSGPEAQAIFARHGFRSPSQPASGP